MNAHPFNSLRSLILNGDPKVGKRLSKMGLDYIPKLKKAARTRSRNSVDKFQIWQRLRELGVELDHKTSNRVLGVVGELGFGLGSALVYGLEDGSASMYTSTGGGMIGAGDEKAVRKAVKELIEAGSEVVTRIPPAESPALPNEGDIHFVILTPGGLRATKAKKDQVGKTKHPLRRLYIFWNNLVTQLNLLDTVRGEEYARQLAKEAIGPYANTLLTLISRKPPSSIELRTGSPLPKLETLAEVPSDIKWLQELALPYDIIPASWPMARIRGYADRKNDPDLNIKRFNIDVISNVDGKFHPMTFQLESISGDDILILQCLGEEE